MASSFPSGLAVGSPTDLSGGGASGGVVTVASAQVSGARVAADWARALWTALREGHGRELRQLAGLALPMGSARATPAAVPQLQQQAELIEKVLAGDTSVSLEQVLKLQELFASGGNASCYGPNMDYRSHQDAAGGGPAGNGKLPSGDLGLWIEYEGDKQPCVAAQLNRRVAGVKGQSAQGLLLMAAMRRAIEASSTLAMPTAGNTTDLKAAFTAVLQAIPALASINVHAATVSLDSTGKTYTYRLALDSGGTGAEARSGEIIMRHSPGASADAYSGVMQISGFWLTGDAASGCVDAKDATSGLLQTAAVTTLRYSRAGSQISFSSRNAQYCGAPTGTASTDWGADVATFLSNGELDPSAKLTGPTRGSVKGWRGNFSRFAGDFERTTVAGSFLYAWQAGTGDSHSRALAVHTDFNTATEARSMNGYFAFANDIVSTDGSLQGMICNWAGPGNQHTPQPRFQSQTATLSASQTAFVIPAGGSKITYAPTNSCSSTGTEYDVNVDGTVAAGEGAGTTANLDAPTGTNTVQQEIVARGFKKPSMF